MCTRPRVYWNKGLSAYVFGNCGVCQECRNKDKREKTMKAMHELYYQQMKKQFDMIFMKTKIFRKIFRIISQS